MKTLLDFKFGTTHKHEYNMLGLCIYCGKVRDPPTWEGFE